MKTKIEDATVKNIMNKQPDEIQKDVDTVLQAGKELRNATAEALKKYHDRNSRGSGGMTEKDISLKLGNKIASLIKENQEPKKIAETIFAICSNERKLKELGAVIPFTQKDKDTVIDGMVKELEKPDTRNNFQKLVASSSVIKASRYAIGLAGLMILGLGVIGLLSICASDPYFVSIFAQDLLKKIAPTTGMELLYRAGESFGGLLVGGVLVAFADAMVKLEKSVKLGLAGPGDLAAEFVAQEIGKKQDIKKWQAQEKARKNQNGSKKKTGL